MQNKTLDHLIKRLRFPDQARQSQAEFNAARVKLVEDAVAVRPYFLPVVHTLPIAASNTPVPNTTDQVRFPVIVTGAISDGEARNVRLFINRYRKALIGFGSSSDLKLSLEAIAGHPVAISGYAGPLEWESPLPLDAYDYLTLEMYQETSPGITEQISTCFKAIRVFGPDESEGRLTSDMRQFVNDRIAIRTAPLTTYDLVKITFSGGVATATTPKDSDEPYLIHGFRSTFTDALISIGYDDQRGFSKSPFPIWALASEKNNSRQDWQLLPRPLLIAPNETLNMRLTNSIDGVNFAADGNIEVLRTTV